MRLMSKGYYLYLLQRSVKPESMIDFLHEKLTRVLADKTWAEARDQVAAFFVRAFSTPMPALCQCCCCPSVCICLGAKSAEPDLRE
jgi:hypothetical protein